MDLTDKQLKVETLKGKEEWTLRFAELFDNDGVTLWDNLEIVIGTNNSKSFIVDTIIHECAHVATCDALSEPAVEAIAKMATQALFAAGIIEE